MLPGLALIVEPLVCTSQVGFAQVVYLGEQDADLGEGGIDALVEVRHMVLVHEGAAVESGRVGPDVDVGDEVGTRRRLHGQVELLGAIDIDGLVEGAQLAGLCDVLRVCFAITSGEGLVERLKPELEMHGVRDREALPVGHARVLAGNRCRPRTIQLHFLSNQ